MQRLDQLAEEISVAVIFRTRQVPQSELVKGRVEDIQRLREQSLSLRINVAWKRQPRQN